MTTTSPRYTCTKCHAAPVRKPHTWCKACRAKARASNKRKGGGGGSAKGGAQALARIGLRQAPAVVASAPIASADYYRDQAERKAASTAPLTQAKFF